MVYFTEFKSSYSPTTDEKVTAEFRQAHDLVRTFSPRELDMETCYARVQRCFSESTRKTYGRAVRAFVREAKKELDERVEEVRRSLVVCETHKRASANVEEEHPSRRNNGEASSSAQNPETGERDRLKELIARHRERAMMAASETDPFEGRNPKSVFSCLVL